MEDNSRTYLRQLEPSELSLEFWGKLPKGQVETLVWQKGQTQPFTAQTDVKASLGEKGLLAVLTADKRNHALIGDQLLGIPVYLKFKLNADIQYFSSGRIERRGTGYVVRLDHPFFVTTKRSTCRYIAMDTDRITLKVAGHEFHCYDVSSGGFSSQVPKGRYGGLEKDMVLEDAELNYQFKVFKIPHVRVLSVLEAPNLKGFERIAFKFEGLKTPEEDAIWKHVNDSVKRMAEILG